MNNTKWSGFSLIELLVVLVILALIGSIVGPQVLKHIGGAKSDSARLQIADLSAGVDMFYLELGDYPSTEEGLKALIEQPVSKPRWNGPYLKKKKIPLDPWGNEYHYHYPGEHGVYDLFSLGKDNSEGGEKENADIVNWN